jgi:hypothetical protein
MDMSHIKRPRSRRKYRRWNPGKSKNHGRGDKFWCKKNHAGSKRVPRKEWCEGKLANKLARKHELLEEIAGL